MVIRKIEKIALEGAQTFDSLLSEESQRSRDYSFLPPIIILGPYSFLKPPLVYEGFT